MIRQLDEIHPNISLPARPIEGELLALVREYRDVTEYYIRVDRRAGDDEGAMLKSITLARIDAVLAKAEVRS